VAKGVESSTEAEAKAGQAMTTPLTAEQRAELRRRHADANAHEWIHSNCGFIVEYFELIPREISANDDKQRALADYDAAELIVRMGHALPALLDAADRADELERQLGESAHRAWCQTKELHRLNKQIRNEHEEIPVRVALAQQRIDGLSALLSEALAYLAEHPSEHDPRRAEKAKLCDRIAAVLK
jgi:hypothetical protein